MEWLVIDEKYLIILEVKKAEYLNQIMEMINISLSLVYYLKRILFIMSHKYHIQNKNILQ